MKNNFTKQRFSHYYLVFVLSNGMDIKEYSKYISNIHNQQLWLILSSGCSFHQVYVSRALLLLYKISDAGTGGATALPPLQYFVDQLTLFEPGRADYPRLLLLAPPNVFHLLASLYKVLDYTCFYSLILYLYLDSD